MTIDTGGFGTSVGQLLGLGLGVKLGVEGFKAIRDIGRPVRKTKRPKRRARRKRPPKGAGLYPTLNFKPTGNLFYPVDWAR